jgi:repressor LexA
MYSNKDITDRQNKVLEFIRDCIREGKGVPTYREIASHFTFRSPRAAADHVIALEKKGYLRRHPGRSRGIELLSGERVIAGSIAVPLLGSIRAGIPEEQTEHMDRMLMVDQTILANSSGHRLFALQVNGESMEGRGIQDGDLVIADTDEDPGEGDIVVALIDGKNTLKTLARQKNHFFLKAENPRHSNLIPLQNMVIQGVVKALVRRMR